MPRRATPTPSRPTTWTIRGTTTTATATRWRPPRTTSSARRAEYDADAYADYERYDDPLPRRRDYDPYEDDRPTTVFRSALNAPAHEAEDDRYGTRPSGQVYGHGSGRHRAELDEEEARPSGRRSAVRGRRQVPLWQELPLLVIIAFSLALVIKTFLLQAFFIPSGSMENTLQVKDRVLVNKVVYQFREPQRGEVIVFRGTDSWAPETELQAPEGFLASAGRTVGSLVGLGTPDEKDFIKRVIGVPGDVVQCCDQKGRILVNGKAMDEGGYVFDNNPVDQRAFGPITVPPGRLFMMGDHRGNSQDSRAYIGDEFKGTIPIDQVIGRAFVKVWPVKRWDDLPVPGSFDTVPAARALGPPPEPGMQRRAPVEVPLVGALLLPFAARGRRRARQMLRLGLGRRPMAARPYAATVMGDMKSRKKSTRSFWVELPILILVAVLVAVVVRTFLVQTFYIPSESMERTLLINDRVLVNKVVYDLRDPKRGEIVVFEPPAGLGRGAGQGRLHQACRRGRRRPCGLLRRQRAGHGQRQGARREVLRLRRQQARRRAVRRHRAQGPRLRHGRPPRGLGRLARTPRIRQRHDPARPHRRARVRDLLAARPYRCAVATGHIRRRPRASAGLI